jgi:hypothetical protein
MARTDKVQAHEVEEEEEPHFMNHCLNVANAIAYLRLVLLATGWIFLEFNSPEIMLAHYIA